VLVLLSALLVIGALAWGVTWLTDEDGGEPAAAPTAGREPAGARDADPSLQPASGSGRAGPGRVESLAGGTEPGAAGDWSDGNLRLRVVEAGSQAPLPAVRLSLYAASAARPEGPDVLGNPIGVPDAVSDSAGLATVQAPPGRAMRLIAYGAAERVGHCVLSIEALRDGERREVRVEMPVASGREYWGRVSDRATKRPLEGATVTLYSSAPVTSSSRVTSAKHPAGGARSDGRGLFVLRPAPWTSGFARIEARGYGPALTEVGDQHADPSMAAELLLTAAGGLDAEVLDGNGGPLKGAVLTVSASSVDLVQPEGRVLLADDVRWSAEIGWDGRARLEDLPADTPLTVQIAQADQVMLRESGALVLKPGEVRRQSWRLGGRARLRGVLLDHAGATIAAQELWLTDDALPARLAGEPCFFEVGDALHVVARCTTDDAGRFEFEAIPAGRWLVGPAPRMDEPAPSQNEAVSPWAVVVDVPPGGSEQPLTLRVARALSIRGRVVDPTGNPLASRAVEAWPAEPGPPNAARCDADGAFVLGPLVAGSWAVRATGGEGLAPSDTIVVMAGTDGLELRLHAPATLVGRLLAPGTEDLPAARITAWLAGGGPGDAPGDAPAATTWSAPDDSFQVDHLGAGRYDLVAHTGDGRVATLTGIEVAAGATREGLELRLGPTARLRIRYDGAQRYGRFTVLHAGSTIAADAVQSGTSQLVAVPPGAVEVRFTAPGLPAQSRSLEVEAEGETELRFEDA